MGDKLNIRNKDNKLYNERNIMSRCEYRTWCELSTGRCYEKTKQIKNKCGEYEVNRFLDYLMFGRKASDETKQKH